MKNKKVFKDVKLSVKILKCQDLLKMPIELERSREYVKVFKESS